MVTGSPGNVDMVGNGFRQEMFFCGRTFSSCYSTRLHGGGGVYLSDKDVEIGSDPFMYWQTNLADQVAILNNMSYDFYFDVDFVLSYSPKHKLPGVVLRRGREQRGMQVQRRHVLGQHARI